MSEPLDYVIDDFLTGGQAHKDHNVNQARHLHGRGRNAVPGRRATGYNPGRGTRGADYGVVQDTSMGQKQMNEYASYLDTKRRHDALVRGGNVSNDVITFRNQESLNAYNNNRGIMVDYETKQYACDRGVANSCSAVGRAVGDGRNPLVRGNEGLLFGWTGGTGRTAPLESRVAVSRRQPLGVFDRPSTSGVDNVPAGGGMIRPQVPSGGGGGGAGRGATASPGEVSELTPVGGGAEDVVVGRPVNPEPAPPPPLSVPRGTDITPPVDTALPEGGVFQPKRQRPRVENAGGGDRDGRDGTASQVGVPQFETLNTGVGIGGVVDAPLVSKGAMMNTIMRFEGLRIQKNIVKCPKDNQLVIHHA